MFITYLHNGDLKQFHKPLKLLGLENVDIKKVFVITNIFLNLSQAALSYLVFTHSQLLRIKGGYSSSLPPSPHTPADPTVA